MKRWCLFLAVLAVVAAGCRKSESGPASTGQGLEVEFWHTQTADNAKALEDLVARYNEENEGRVRVRLLFQGNYDQLYQKTMAAISAGRPPDMAVAYESMVAEYMKAGLVQPLDEMMQGPDGLDQTALQDIFPGYLESNRFAQFGNQYLSFPFTKSVLVLYYNEEALKEAGFAGPPKTWDEFRDAAIKTTKRDASGKVTRYGFGLWADASTIHGCILSRGGELVTEDGAQVLFNAEPGKDHFRLIAELVEKGAATRTTKAQYPADFGNGRIAMFIGSSTAREFVTPAVAGKFPWGITVIPQVNPEKPVTVQYGANVAVFKTTPEKQRAAWSFVRWLAEPNQTAYWATHSTYMPLRRSVADRPEMKVYWEKDPQAQQCFEVAQYGVREPNVRGWQDVRKFMEEAFDKVVSGQKAPEAALAEAATKANAALKERQ